MADAQPAQPPAPAAAPAPPPPPGQPPQQVEDYDGRAVFMSESGREWPHYVIGLRDMLYKAVEDALNIIVGTSFGRSGCTAAVSKFRVF